MESTFKYYYVKQSYGELQISDIGNCVIEANNDVGGFYYLIIKTDLGYSKILRYGPIDDFMVESNVYFKQIEYNENKLLFIIKNFLQDPKANITQAQEITEEEALTKYKDLSTLIKE